MPTLTIRVLLAYGDPLSRAGIRVLLESLPGVKVVGEAPDGRGALATAKRRKPDIALLEDSLMGLNGVEVATRLSREAPAVKSVILSDLADAQTVANVLRSGAKGYILKSTPPNQLSRALTDVYEGRVHVSSGVSKKLLSPGKSSRSSRDRLTPRQREILQMVAEGWSTKQIAQILRISVKTVETHRAQLMDRLGIFDVPGLVRYAIKTRLSRL
jgi:DNA-binding NarL/FixJ family response regulator